MDFRWCWAAVVLLSFAVCARGGTAATLRTRDTSITFAAHAEYSQVVSVNEWENHAPEKFLSSVMLDGRAVAVRWKFRRSDAGPRRVAFIYDCASPHLRLTWEWTTPAATGPLEHSIHIANLGTREIWIPLQDDFDYGFQVGAGEAIESFFVEKGAGAPSAEGTHLESLPVGMRWQGTSSTYAHPRDGEAREVLPFLALERSDTAKKGWYMGVEFSGRMQLSVARDAVSVYGAVRLNPEPGPFRSRLQPGETFDTPTVFVGAFRGGVDALGNVLRPWVREVLGNPVTWKNPEYPLLTNNSWGSGMQVDEALALQMIRDSADLGLEMFHLDAGWFRGVGDWVADPRKFPNGLRPLAEAAHQNGLKFGLWTDWAQAALDTFPGALNLRDPEVRDWTVSDLPADWKPEEFKGQTIDIGVPAAAAYAQREVLRMVEENHLDMLEHDGYLVAQGCVRSDHPHAPPAPGNMAIVKDQGSYFVESSNSTDVSYHAVRAYYQIYAELRKRHPGLLLEICNDGGRMVDFGSAAHGDYFSVTDSYDPVSNRRAFYDASHLLPAAMLESYVEKWPTPAIENFRYVLRSGMMGWLTIMLDTSAWSTAERAVAKDEIQLYKTALRPFIRDANLYHIAARPDGVHWDGVEFFDARRRCGVVYVFRGSGKEESRHTFRLTGLDASEMYRVRFQDHSAVDRVMRGDELEGSGLTLTLPIPNSSELVFVGATS